MSSQSAATLRARYVEQAASDLRENRRRQEELAEKIKMLQQEEALLRDILTLAERFEGSSYPGLPLPRQIRDEPAPDAASADAPPAATAPATVATAAASDAPAPDSADAVSPAEPFSGKEAAEPAGDAPSEEPPGGGSPTAAAGATAEPQQPAAASTKGEPRRPLLGDVLMDLLGAHGEPRPAKELRDELMAKHPDRAPTPQVVRNTLEALVAKSRIRRHKQQRSVMYSLVRPAPRKAASRKAAGTGDPAGVDG